MHSNGEETQHFNYKGAESCQGNFPLPPSPLSFVCCSLICAEPELTSKGSSLSGEHQTALIAATSVIAVCLSTLIKVSNWNFRACLRRAALTRWCARRVLVPSQGMRNNGSGSGVNCIPCKHRGLPCKPSCRQTGAPTSLCDEQGTAHAVSESDGWHFQVFLASSSIMYSSTMPLVISAEGSQCRAELQPGREEENPICSSPNSCSHSTVGSRDRGQDHPAALCLFLRCCEDSFAVQSNQATDNSWLKPHSITPQGGVLQGPSEKANIKLG